MPVSNHNSVGHKSATRKIASAFNMLKIMKQRQKLIKQHIVLWQHVDSADGKIG